MTAQVYIIDSYSRGSSKMAPKMHCALDVFLLHGQALNKQCALFPCNAHCIVKQFASTQSKCALVIHLPTGAKLATLQVVSHIIAAYLGCTQSVLLRQLYMRELHDC